ncbi:sensitivity to red-light reduced protein [Mortierella sp. GBA30]|nr:sensitivity to red-light reduced protein [Mortierella sp. GBA30]
MIVDDSSVNLTILSRILTQHFAESLEIISEMTSGTGALTVLNSEPMDLIFMDIDMPGGLNGVETTIAIRQNSPKHPVLKENQYVPIIAVTTSDGQEQRELYMRTGMADCVGKPVQVQKLRLAIEGALDPKKLNITRHS